MHDVICIGEFTWADMLMWYNFTLETRFRSYCEDWTFIKEFMQDVGWSTLNISIHSDQLCSDIIYFHVAHHVKFSIMKLAYACVKNVEFSMEWKWIMCGQNVKEN